MCNSVQAHQGHVGVSGIQAHSAGPIFPCVLRITQEFRDPLFKGESLQDRCVGGRITVLDGERAICPDIVFDNDGDENFAWAHDRAYDEAHRYLGR